MQNINADEAFKLIGENFDIIILDVRTPQEFENGHIDKAINIDFYANDFRDKLEILDKDQIYLVYCRSGHRSLNTLNIMNDLKFNNIYNMNGGIISWQNNNYPITK